jgi:hypothetical protein
MSKVHPSAIGSGLVGLLIVCRLIDHPPTSPFAYLVSESGGASPDPRCILKTNIDLFGAHLDPPLDIVAMSQLGAAVVLLWPTLSRDDQARLLELTPVVSGIPTVPNATHRVLDLVERNKPSFL